MNKETNVCDEDDTRPGTLFFCVMLDGDMASRWGDRALRRICSTREKAEAFMAEDNAANFNGNGKHILSIQERYLDGEGEWL